MHITRIPILFLSSTSTKGYRKLSQVCLPSILSLYFILITHSGFSSLPLWIRNAVSHLYSIAPTRLKLIHVTHILLEQLAKPGYLGPKTLSRRNGVTSRRRTMGARSGGGPYGIEHRRELVSDNIHILDYAQAQAQARNAEEGLFSPADEVLSSPPIATPLPFVISVHDDTSHSTNSKSLAPEYNPPLTNSTTPSLAVHSRSKLVSNPTNSKPKWPKSGYDILFASAQTQYDPDDRHIEDISETRSYFDACDAYYRGRKEGRSRRGKGQSRLF